MKVTTKFAIAAATLAGVALMGMQPAQAGEPIQETVYNLRARGTEHNSGINYLPSYLRVTSEGEMVASTEPTAVITGEESEMVASGEPSATRNFTNYVNSLRHTTPNSGNDSIGSISQNG